VVRISGLDRLPAVVRGSFEMIGGRGHVHQPLECGATRVRAIRRTIDPPVAD